MACSLAKIDVFPFQALFLEVESSERPVNQPTACWTKDTLTAEAAARKERGSDTKAIIWIKPLNLFVPEADGVVSV